MKCLLRIFGSVSMAADKVLPLAEDGGGILGESSPGKERV